jgi:hypothetical protein
MSLDLADTVCSLLCNVIEQGLELGVLDVLGCFLESLLTIATAFDQIV